MPENLTASLSPSAFDAQLWANRHEPPVLAQCDDFLRAQNDSFDWLWRRARLEHFLFMQNENTKEKSNLHIEAAHRWAQSALKTDEKRVESVFWAATCELEWAQTRGKIWAARALGHCEKQLDAACGHDESFHHGGPLRVLGRVIARKPLILGGNLERALTFYEASLRFAPHNSTTLLYKADALIRDNQPGRAKKTLRFLLEKSDGSDWQWETLRDRDLAAKWLQNRF